MAAMELDCRGCAGCCLDWRALVPDGSDHERRGRYDPLDDRYNLVSLTREGVRGFLEAGLADALTPRLWAVDDDAPGVDLDGRRVAAIEGSPAFFLGLRQPPKPVGPFGAEPTWLPTCVFLDPTTLQCRIHESDLYPQECADYPGQNLRLGAETECERVEDAFGGDRLLDATVPDDVSTPRLGPQAVGHTVFVHPAPRRLEGVVDRLEADTLEAADRAEFVAAAAAAAPGTAGTNRAAFERAYDRALAAGSWAGRASEEWARLAATDQPVPGLAERVEDGRGAPATPGWD